jgi:hypothetical protein
MDMIGLDRQPNDLSVVFIRYLLHDLLQTVMHWPDKHHAPLRTPDNVVHDQVDTMLLVLIVHVAIMVFFNSVCKPERPFIGRS